MTEQHDTPDNPSQPAPARRRRRAPRQTDAPAANPPDNAAADESPPVRRTRRRRPAPSAGAPPSQEADAAPQSPPGETAQEVPRPARRRRRSPRQTEAAPAADAPRETEAAAPAHSGETADDAPKPPRRRRRSPRQAEAAPAAQAAEAVPPADASDVKQPRRSARPRRAAPLIDPPARGAGRQERDGASRPRRKKGEGPDETRDVSFMHPSEQEFAKLLDYYKVPYLYEPRSFPLRWEGNRVVEMFSPDFYLPEQDQYFELTTMKQSLVTQKNRKLRQAKELYPEVNIQLLYRRDYVRLLGKYGYGPLSDAEVKGLGRVLFAEEQIQARVGELAREIEEDYAGQAPVFVGVLRGAFVFMADLIRKAGELTVETDFISVSRYGGGQDRRVEVIRDVDVDLAGRHVILVEGIVDTGMSLRPIMQHVQAKRPASVEVCAMFDKRARRVVDVPLRYAGFEIPDEFVVGYGLDHDERYRNLPYLSAMSVVEPKPVPQR